MLKDFQPRLYQETILATCAAKNTLVVLPTGMGKSIVFVMLAVQRLKSFPGSKIVVLAPTKPLAEQHLQTFQKYTAIKDAVLFTGEVAPEKRAEDFVKNTIIVSTPQGLENDIISGRMNFKDVSLLVLDECHKATKGYSYVWLAQQYLKHANYPRVLGLTASPGSDLEQIKEVMQNLGIEAIEARTEDDPDVKPYIQDVEIKFISVQLSEDLKKIQKYLKDFLKDRRRKLGELGVRANVETIGKKELLALQAQMQGQVARGEKDFESLKAMSVLAEIMKMLHALELLESQGIHALHTYMEKLSEDSETTSTKAVKNLVNDINFRSAKILVEELIREGKEHPKYDKIKEILKELKGKAIIFNNYRDNAAKLAEELKKEGYATELFVGQAKKSGTGLTQKKQAELIRKFSAGEFQIMVMTSVGEEGLDIPSVDLVVFFEPVPSAIRSIQRKGRTGRLAEGKVIVLATQGTRDEAYKWSSFRKEKNMYSHLKTLKKEMPLLEPQKTLQEYKEEVTIYADHREKNSRALKYLIDKGVKLELKQLEVADYILSDNVGVEIKTVPDFVNSILDGRLLEQLKDLKYNFKNPLLIVEGEEDLYSVRNVHPNAIRGMLATVVTTFGIPVLTTKTSPETAELLISIAKKEQEKGGSFSAHSEKRGVSLQEQQEYFVSSLPQIGGKLARELLEHFGTPQKIVNASEEELRKVEKIGEVKAKKLKEMFEKEYR